MNEVQEDTISETKETDYKDLQSLLEAANLSEFNPETGYTEEKHLMSIPGYPENY